MPLLVEHNPDGSSAKQLEQKLLDFEAELDSTMATLRKNLMIIRLLGLMSEDDQLQDSLMRNSEQLLDFILLTLKRGASVVARKAKKPDIGAEKDAPDEEEYEPQMLEIQSLTMALTLLNLKVIL